MVAQPAPQSPVSTTKARRSTTKAKATPPADAEVVQAKPASARKKAEASGTALQPTPAAVEPPIRKRRASTSVVDTAPVAEAPEASAAPADDRSSTKRAPVTKRTAVKEQGHADGSAPKVASKGSAKVPSAKDTPPAVA